MTRPTEKRHPGTAKLSIYEMTFNQYSRGLSPRVPGGLLFGHLAESTPLTHSRCRSSTVLSINSGKAKHQTREVSAQRSVQKRLLRRYTEVIKPGVEPPPNWRDSTIKVIYQSGCPSSARSPSCTKLFSQVLFRRLQPTLDAHQSVDQAGQATPRLTTCTPFSSVGTVEHSNIWSALREQVIGAIHTVLHNTLRQETSKRAHGRQKQTVPLQAGTTQGDSLRTLLFNALLQYIMQPMHMPHAHTHAHTHTHRYTHTHRHTYTYTYTRTHIHTYTYAYT